MLVELLGTFSFIDSLLQEVSNNHHYNDKKHFLHNF